MKKLCCTNKKCPASTSNNAPAFVVYLTVGATGELTETVQEIPGEDFTCTYCKRTAEWTEMEGQADAD